MAEQCSNMSMAAVQWNHLEPDQLAGLLKGPERDQVCVVDVRDEDFAGGHIKEAINICEPQIPQLACWHAKTTMLYRITG